MQSSEERGSMNGGAESPQEIERAIAGTRAALESTVEELGERLQPSQIAADARSYVRERASRGASEVWRSVREHPMPAALVASGVGVVLGMRHGANGARHARWDRRSAMESLLDGAHVSELGRWLASAGGRLGDVATTEAQGAARAARKLAAGARSELPATVRDADDWLRDAAQRQPLLALGVALAAGYGLARLAGRR